MIEIRRDEDGELCGFVHEADGTWLALTVFGSVFAHADDHDDAVAHVLGSGLAVLAERWQLHTADAPDPEVVCIVEADPTGVTVALGYYALPGVPTRRITRSEIDTATVVLERS